MAAKSASTSSKMTLYTCQTLKAYDILVKTGSLSCDREHADKDFIKAYDWLKDQMIQRGITPKVDNSEDVYPIWAWYDFGGEIPDCDSADLGIPNETMMFLKLEVEPSRVLLSDFDLWHYPINGWYLAKNEVEDEPPEIYDDTYYENEKASWSRIFDLYDKELLEYHGMLNSPRYIQGVLWSINLEDVVFAKKFVCR